MRCARSLVFRFFRRRLALRNVAFFRHVAQSRFSFLAIFSLYSLLFLIFQVSYSHELAINQGGAVFRGVALGITRLHSGKSHP